MVLMKYLPGNSYSLLSMTSRLVKAGCYSGIGMVPGYVGREERQALQTHLPQVLH